MSTGVISTICNVGTEAISDICKWVRGDDLFEAAAFPNAGKSVGLFNNFPPALLLVPVLVPVVGLASFALLEKIFGNNSIECQRDALESLSNKLQRNFQNFSKQFTGLLERISKIESRLTKLEQLSKVKELEDISFKASSKPAPGAPKTGFVEQVFANDLVDQARKSAGPDVTLDPNDLIRLMSSLSLIDTPNALLVGPPGVGKTTLVEGLAYLIAKGDVPEAFKDAKILSLSASSIQSGCMYVGMVEARVERLIQEVKKRTLAGEKIILFIDEFHAVMKSGSTSTNQFGEMIKTAMARGEIKIIGATTNAELEIISEDTALMRRFNVIDMKEPTGEILHQIVRSKLEKYASRHQIKISDFDEIAKYAIDKSNDLKNRGLLSGFQPHIAVNLLDKMIAQSIVRNDMADGEFDKFVFERQLKRNFLQVS